MPTVAARTLIQPDRLSSLLAANVVADVTNKASCDAAAQGVLQAFGRIDVLVNNAGITQPVKTLEITGADYDRILDVNLRGERVFPVVDVLRERRVPMVFTTGYEQWALPDAYADVPRCEKPVETYRLVRALFGGSIPSTGPA